MLPRQRGPTRRCRCSDAKTEIAGLQHDFHEIALELTCAIRAIFLGGAMMIERGADHSRGERESPRAPARGVD